MPVILALLLGLIQGIAEFLPISSSGHLSVLQNLIGVHAEEGHLLFDVLLHLGTMVSIIVYYRKDIRAMFSDTFRLLRGEDRVNDWVGEAPATPSVRIVILIFVATLPLFIAIPFMGYIETLFYKTGFTGFALIMTGALLYASDKFVTHGYKNEKTIRLSDAFIIGLAQMIALIPGLSRSGTTIAVGMSRGLSRDFSIKFSLLLSLPAVLGSTIITLVKAFKSGVDFSMMPIYLAGCAVAAGVGYLSIGLLRRIMSKGKFGYFAYYCAGAGVVTILLSVIL